MLGKVMCVMCEKDLIQTDILLTTYNAEYKNKQEYRQNIGDTSKEKMLKAKQQ